MTTALVGREAEALAIAAFLDRVPSGPVGLSIEGDPGIGKTTLWLEAVRQAESRGYRVLRARPAEQEEQLSFAALGDLLRDVMAEVEGSLPEPQRDALRAALLLDAGEATADPRTTATGLMSVLVAVAEHGPVVIAIDDAQWVDRASQRALAFSFRRLPGSTGVIAARRPAPGVDSLDLTAAIGQPDVAQIHLAAMPDDGLRRLIAAEAPGLTPPGLTRVVDAAGGNPFHAIEIARTVGQADAPLRGSLPIPASLGALVRERLDRLSEPARAAATAVALSFRPTRATVRLALDPDADVDAALLEAEEVGVLAWDADRLRFSHPLLGAALHDALSTGRRRALHGRLSRTVDDPLERAHHLVGSDVGRNEDAARSIELGASVAERRGAVDAAAGLYLAARERTPEADGDGQARRALGAARTSFKAGDLLSARRLAEEALGGTADAQIRAGALLLLTSIASYAGTIEERIAAHEAALAEAEGDTDLRAQVLSIGARLTVDPWRAMQQAQEAVRLLRTAGDHERLAQALINQVMASAVLGLGAPRALLEEVVALEAAAPRRRVDPLVWFHWMDDVAATTQRFDIQVRLARDEGDEFAVAELAEFMAMIEFRAGHWESAEVRLEAACLKLQELEPRGPLLASFADRSVVDAHRGRMERARGTLQAALNGPVPPERFWAAVCLSALGAVEFLAGDLRAADQAWTAMRQSAVSVGWIEFPEDRSEPDHVEALLALGELARAREVLTHLEWRGRTIPRYWIDATLPRARALVMAAEGRLADALEAIENAPLVSALPFERARMLMVKGQLERRANRKLRARESLEAARLAFEDLGSPPWIDRAARELGRLGLRHGARDELTAMERRIAELAATGLTNREVADAASVSPKTVEANLARAYDKLGIRSRAELGARMAARSATVEHET